MATQPTEEPLVLPHEACAHGMSDKNWCALCRQANGDKHANTIIKAFSPKTPKRNYAASKIKADSLRSGKK